jgi:hypothetical protein
MFRQDYRINKIFLPFQKKGKKHHPSSREAVKKIKSLQLILSENILARKIEQDKDRLLHICKVFRAPPLLQ